MNNQQDNRPPIWLPILFVASLLFWAGVGCGVILYLLRGVP